MDIDLARHSLMKTKRREHVRFYAKPRRDLKSRKGFPDIFDQTIIELRFPQNLEDTGARRPLVDRVIGLTGDEDHGKGRLPSAQLREQFQAIHQGHAIIDNKAPPAG